MRALIVLLLMLVAACSPSAPTVPTTSEDTARRDALATAVKEAKAGDVVDLAAVLGADWDRAVFIGPYSDNRSARDLLGFDFDIERVSPWSNSEGGMVVVLASGSKPVAWFSVPSGVVGLHCLADASIPPQRARLVVVEESGGFRSLADPERDGCSYDITGAAGHRVSASAVAPRS